MKGVCKEGEWGGLLMNAAFCEDIDGDDDGAGELSDAGGMPPRNISDIEESGNTNGRGFGLAFGLVNRPTVKASIFES